MKNKQTIPDHPYYPCEGGQLYKGLTIREKLAERILMQQLDRFNYTTPAEMTQLAEQAVEIADDFIDALNEMPDQLKEKPHPEGRRAIALFQQLEDNEYDWVKYRSVDVDKRFLRLSNALGHCVRCDDRPADQVILDDLIAKYEGH